MDETIWTCLVFMLAVYGGNAMLEEDKVRVCYGTENGLSFSQSLTYHYQRLRKRYSDCTHVYGNLEITLIDGMNNQDFNLDFLSKIRVVTGYIVLVALDFYDVIPLPNLRFIRGDSTFEYQGHRYSLFISLVAAKELQMPNLKEIANGKVALLFSDICYINSVNWNVITPEGASVKNLTSSCGDCSSNCLDKDGQRRCWGENPDMCQRVQSFECDWICRGRPCFKEGLLGCCHPECAGGCTGPRPTQCEVCRNFRYRNRCVQKCPELTLHRGSHCIDL